jgi:hypothetical protein
MSVICEEDRNLKSSPSTQVRAIMVKGVNKKHNVILVAGEKL